MDDRKAVAIIVVAICVFALAVTVAASYTNYLNAGLIRDCIAAHGQPQVSSPGGSFQTCIPARGGENAR